MLSYTREEWFSTTCRVLCMFWYIPRCWFQICVIFTPKIGQDSHFDYVVMFFQKGLVQPPTRFLGARKMGTWTYPIWTSIFVIERFSSTCWYFAESLVDRLNDDRPIGLIHTAWGGRTLDHLVNQGPNIWDTTLMATRNPVNSPVELGSFFLISHYLQGFNTSQVVQDFFHQQYQERMVSEMKGDNMGL